MSLLELADVHTYYGESHILQGVSLSLQAGEVVAVVGRNGVGKTTMIRSIVGFTPPRRGKVLLEGREIQQLTPERRSRLGIGLVPQGRRIFPSLTVLEHLRLAARTGTDGHWTLAEVFRLFPRLAERQQHFGGQLSGGEQQMLAIGRALVTNPRVLLMDEPTEGLAPLIVEEVGKAIQLLAERKLSIILVEQNLPLALRVSRTAYVMSKGRVVFQGQTDELARNEEIRHQHLGV